MKLRSQRVDVYLFNFTRTCQTSFPSGYTILHSYRQLFHILTKRWCHSEVGHPSGMKRFFTVVSVVISLMTKILETFFICLVDTCIALLLSVPVCYLLSIKMVSSLKGSVWEAPPWARVWLLYQGYFVVVIATEYRNSHDCLALLPLVTRCSFLLFI